MTGSSKPTLLQVIASVLASFFGVQSDNNYQRDFEQTSVVPYIVVGIVMVIVLIGALLLLVPFLDL